MFKLCICALYNAKTRYFEWSAKVEIYVRYRVNPLFYNIYVNVAFWGFFYIKVAG